MKAIWMALSLVMGSIAASAVSATGQDVARLISSNLSSHYQSPAKLRTTVAFSCGGAKGHYALEQSSDESTGYFRVEFIDVEVSGRSLPAPGLARINGALAGPAMLRSSFVSCSGQYVNIQLDLHRMTSKPTAPTRSENASYIIEMNGGQLLKAGRLED